MVYLAQQDCTGTLLDIFCDCQQTLCVCNASALCLSVSVFLLALMVSLEQRLLVLNRGMHETRPEVRAADNLLVGKWWRVDCAGDALLMVGLLDVAHSHSKCCRGHL